MSRLAARFEALREHGRKALVSFITAGDPDPAHTVAMMHSLVAGGADVVELGVPFSDPMADGPVIQKASERALARGTTLARVLELVSEFRSQDDQTPVVLMGYLNPFERKGYEPFARDAGRCGVDGVITVDLPPEEAGPLQRALARAGVDLIFLIAPTSDRDRIRRICEMASGFVYYVSLKGVTGAATLDVGSVATKVAEIKARTSLPVGVGFGIRDPQSAARVAAVSDAVVVGTVLVQRIEQMADRPQDIGPALIEVLSDMRRAMDNVAGA